MRVPSSPSEQCVRWTIGSRTAAWAAAIVLALGASALPAAAAGPGGVPSAADARAIAKRLAAAAPGERGNSCAVEEAGLTSLPVFSGSASAGARIDTSGAAPALAVMCALPYDKGQTGADCNGKHTVKYQVLGAGPNAKVTAELMGLDTNGNLLKSFLVENGDAVQLASRLPQGAWKFQAKKKDYTVFAPVPLLKVTVEDQGQKAEAYCSNIPWVDVVEPSGGVVSDADGSATHVLAAVPLTNPASAHLYVDGDDLLAQVPNFLGCSYLSPCDGTATINGQPVGYTDLVVDVASGIGALASNTVRATLHDLSCGGHFVRVSAGKLPGSLKTPTSAACNVDDLTDKGSSSVFAVSISDPTPGQVTPLVPTPVAGAVCSGTPIVDVNVNGKKLSVAGQTHVTGDGETSGDVYTVVIDTSLDRTDLVRDALETHDAPLGTFDAGTNRLAVSAREKGGRRAYKRVIFATGNVAPIGVDVNANVFQSSAMQAAVNEQLKQLVEGKVQNTLTATTTDLQNAFVVGLSAAGTQTMFTNLCSKPLNAPGDPLNGLTPGQIFKKKVTEAINSIGQPKITPDVPCASDPEVTLSITNVSVGDTLACNVTFTDGKFSVAVGLPDIHVDVHAFGTGGDWGDTICVEGVKIEGNAFADVSGIKLQFDVTENNLLQNTFSNANFNAGATVASNGSVGASFCGASVLCNVAITIFTLGAVDINPEIDFSLVQDFSSQIGASQPDPIKLNQIKVDEQVVANFDQKVSGAVTEVHITPAGITAGLKGTFATTALDLDVEGTPGITLTPAPVPGMAAMQQQGAKDALIGLSDDAINMMFASLTAAGKLKAGDEQGCFDTNTTIGSLLPADCDTLVLGDGLATAGARGYCHAIRGTNCDSLNYNNDGFLTATEQGICHGASGSTCSTISPQGDLVKIGACSITPNFNLHATQPLLFCAKGDVPPRMLFPNGGAPGTNVPAALRLNDFTVALVVDRTENHQIDGALAAAPGCFTAGANAADCNVFSACLDLNLNFGMQFLNNCPGGKPGFKSTFDSIQVLAREVGVVCSGAASPTTDDSVLGTASNEAFTIPIGTNAGALSPDICGAGLDLGGFVTCDAPLVLSIEADGSPKLRDYLGVTCRIK
jgi:hypothetical protein